MFFAGMAGALSPSIPNIISFKFFAPCNIAKLRNRAISALKHVLKFINPTS